MQTDGVYPVRGKRALITAASQGLGKAVASLLTAQGADVMICSRDERRIEAAAAEIERETGRRPRYLAADVSSEQDVRRLVDEAVGAMGAMHAQTVEYLKTRKQFGVPIGSFQTLQHRAVDMFVALEQARSMAMFAAMMAQEDDAAERARAVSAAKVQIGRSGKFVGQQAIQLHGGVGMTMELKVGHYFKRVTMIDLMFGDADHHLSKLAEAGGLIAA